MSGLIAFGLQWLIEVLLQQVGDWQRFTRNIFGASLRQLLGVAPIEEGCKLIATAIPTYYLHRQHRLRASTIFLFAIAVSLGFTAQENVLYVLNNTDDLFDRIIGTPFHVLFTAPWGYALSTCVFVQRWCGYRKYFLRAWLNSVVCHALVNIIAIAGHYEELLRFLSYGLFPFLLWMYWRFEQLLRLVQDKRVVTLISGLTPQLRLWQRGLVIFALWLGGNAIYGSFVLIKIVSPLVAKNLFDVELGWFILNRTAINLIFSVVAGGIYYYLLISAKKQGLNN